MAICLVALCGSAAFAREKLPRHRASSHPPADTVFSSPDAEPDVVPAFVGKGGKPINTERPPRLAGFEQAKLLSDLTPDQRRRINQLQSDTNERVRAVQEHLNAVQQKLNVAKAHPSEIMMVQGDVLPKPSELKAEIAELRENIQRKRREAVEELGKILTPTQREEIERMRQGELLMSQPTLPKVADDNEKPVKKGGTVFGAFTRKVRERFGSQKTEPD
jgi:hypothetical protein